MILKKNSLNKWRGAFMLSAAFFCLTFVVVSCKKKTNPLGEDALPQESVMSSSGIDTFQLYTYTVEEDSVVTTNPAFNLIGSYHDPVFGTFDASFYTQFSLSGFSPNFGDLTNNEIAIDSLILAFEYGGYYGKISPQLFEVYEITEDLSQDSAYLSSSTVTVDMQNLVPTANNEGLIEPSPLTEAVVGTDTVNPQLCIPLDTVFARDLMTTASNSATNEDFIADFKGLHVKVNNGVQNPGEGGIFYLASVNPASKMTVYYRKNGESFKFDFLIGNAQVDFNHVQIDNSGTAVDQVISDSTFGQTQFYAQAFKSRAKIDFPSLSNLPKDVIIHEAFLDIPVEYFSGNEFYPSSGVSISSRLYAGDDKIYLINPNVPYNQQTRSYKVNLRTYVQNMLNGEIVNDGILISPRLFNTSAERIIFNGPQTTNKKMPVLNVVYTKL
ncbi:MAG: DUF4270 family protein [Brumimicrobium sp.]|nr:DUF4270 family protein [Brumimicrobium sp.]